MIEILKRFAAAPGLGALILLASLIINVMGLVSSVYVILVLNRYVAHGVDATLVTLTAGGLLAVVAEFVFRRLRNRFADDLSFRPDIARSERGFGSLLRTRFTALMQVHPGMRRQVAMGSDTVNAAASPSNVAAVVDTPFAVLFLAAILLIHWHLAMLVGVILVIIALQAWWANASIGRLAGQQVSQSGRSAAIVSSGIDAAETVRAFNGAAYLARLWRQQVAETRKLTSWLNKSRSSLIASSTSSTALMTILVVGYGAVMVVRQEMDIGAVIGVNILAGRILMILSRTWSLGAAFSAARQNLGLQKTFSRLPLEPSDGAELSRLQGALEFKDLSFLYPGSSRIVMEGFNLKIQPGTVLAISGNNAAGKTTFARLLVGLLEPSRGQVLVDGVDLRQLNPEWWRGQIQYLPQEPTFLPGTIRDNIILANSTVDAERLARIVADAGLKDFIDQTSDGLAGEVKEGARDLALGIRKRLALARAMATDGQLIIFDDPTEGLDEDGLTALYSLLNRMAQEGRTIVICSNDPRLLKAAHFVVDMNRKPTPTTAVRGEVQPVETPVGSPDKAARPVPLHGDEVMEEQADRGSRISAQLFLLASFALLASAAAWSWYGKMDIVSAAVGEVKPSSRIKTVQHLEGGIVSRILVEEGDEVRAGQPLVDLEAVQSDADLGELMLRIDSLRTEIARLEAEAEDRDSVTFDTDLVERRPELVAQARTLFRTRRDGIENQIAQAGEQVRQREESVREIVVRVENTRKALRLLNEQVRISEDLLKEQITSRYEHLELLREQNNLRSRISEDSAAIKAAEAAAAEAERQVVQIRSGYREQVQRQLEDARRDLQEFGQRIRKLEDNLERTILRAPEDGVVKQLHVSTVGGVVRPGEGVVDLVPVGDALIVEAALPTHEIGYVREGQEASIRLAAPHLARFGKIDGEVTHISPDSIVTPDGLAFYHVRIATKSDRFTDGEEVYKLVPGMQVQASILTGERRLAEYLLDPFLGSLNRAFQER